MNITLTFILTSIALLMILIVVSKIAINEKKLNKHYKTIIESKDNVINALYKNAEQVQEIRSEKDEKIKVIKEAENEEDVLDIIRAVANCNNDKLREQKEK